MGTFVAFLRTTNGVASLERVLSLGRPFYAYGPVGCSFCFSFCCSCSSCTGRICRARHAVADASGHSGRSARTCDALADAPRCSKWSGDALANAPGERTGHALADAPRCSKRSCDALADAPGERTGHALADAPRERTCDALADAEGIRVA